MHQVRCFQCCLETEVYAGSMNFVESDGQVEHVVAESSMDQELHVVYVEFLITIQSIGRRSITRIDRTKRGWCQGSEVWRGYCIVFQ